MKKKTALNIATAGLCVIMLSSVAGAFRANLFFGFFILGLWTVLIGFVQYINSKEN